MDLNQIYSTIFPIGGVDDNNRYTDLTGDKINAVQLVEPSLSVTEFILTKKETYDKNNRRYKYAYRIPLISVDEYLLNPLDLTYFKLDYTGFLPLLTFEFVDSANAIMSTSVPKDGSIIKVYIGGNGDELYYKPIRQDFVLTSIRKIGGGADNMKGHQVIKYRVYGKLNVPYGYRKESWCSGESSAMQALFNIAIWTGLGFATNFTNPNTLDNMNWRNNETGTYFDFMEDITAHACYSPNTFFTSFIDQYNVLNFVECHSLLSHGGEKTDMPAMIYKCYPPQDLPEYDPANEKTTKNQLPLQENDDDLDNSHQKLSYYFISNNKNFDGWSNYIQEYHEISNGGSALSDGLKTFVTYTDSNVGNWGMTNCSFCIRPIDNLKRDSATQNIEVLPDEPTKDSYIPLNLVQMTNADYLDEQSSVDNMTSVESVHNFGEVDTSNTFKQYYFAEVQNGYQMKCMKKCGLRVKLQNYNPAITKFSRIWVDIYDSNDVSKTQISKTEVYKDRDTGDYLTYVESKNANILSFDGEAEKDMYGVYNRGLSGWYVVTEIEIDYNNKDNNLNMNLLLNRIEYRPCFKDEYVRAREAVNKKYKDDNIITELI